MQLGADHYGKCPTEGQERWQKECPLCHVDGQQTTLPDWFKTGRGPGGIDQIESGGVDQIVGVVPAGMQWVVCECVAIDTVTGRLDCVTATTRGERSSGN
ncbi:unnamed protein product [Nippostrongylus brasiliensis]|uniref:Transposase n=1 Tax=Nippostrongylus brasiliensis TaxID=27835 RepID=A0A0N4XE10_NIPBR|nr:unnamed protein product [Nippostrongylus brasiliensis]